MRCFTKAFRYVAIIVITSGLVLLVAPPAAQAADCKVRDDLVSQPQDVVPWPMERLQPDLAWPQSRGAGVTVAVIDSGVNADHPALEGRVVDGKDYVSSGTAGKCDESDQAHGTFVAGIIAGTKRDGDQYYGVAPEAKILPIRYNPGTEDGEWDPDDIPAAIRWAADQDADVINMSFRQEPSEKLRDAIDYAHDAGAVLVGVAGNVGDPEENEEEAEPSVYPAKYGHVIGVGGIDQNGAHSQDSVTGDHVALAAPSEAIPGPTPGGYAEAEKGTSFAAAFVSGTAALVRAKYPDLGPEEVAQRMFRTASNAETGRNDTVGYGTVNPYRAVTSLRDEPVAMPAADDTVVDGQGANDPYATATAVAWVAVTVTVAGVTALLWGRSMAAYRRGKIAADGVAPTAAGRLLPRGRAEEFQPTLGTGVRFSGPRTQRSGRAGQA